jgi:hypothetical protein
MKLCLALDDNQKSKQTDIDFLTEGIIFSHLLLMGFCARVIVEFFNIMVACLARPAK